jgi:serine protease inhibitor
MTKRFSRSIGALAGVAVLVTACGGSGDAADQDDDVTTEAQTVRADLERREPPASAPVDQVVAGLHDFTLELAGQGDTSENLVVSPTSIAVAFAMAQAGAGDETAAQIAELFGFPDQPQVHEAMNALTATLESANRSGGENGDGDEVILELANAMWGQQGREIGQEFLDTMATEYGAGLQATDFQGDPTGSRDTINHWVSEATRERIPDLIPEGMITPRTVAMLVNAIYLKAAWASEFSEDATEYRPFHLADGSTVDVPTMSQTMLATEAFQGDGYSAVELPYVGGDLAMTVVVPDGATSLADFEDSLDGARLGEIVDGLEPATVDLDLPRWDIETKLDLAEPLTAMGLPIPGGDLSGIIAEGTIAAAVHAADITVDEHGTEAAAATAIAVDESGAPMPGQVLEISVDRPFLFLVRHVETGTPLFYGRVTNPTP